MRTRALGALVFGTLAACAGNKITSDAEGRNETGLRYYTARPVMLPTKVTSCNNRDFTVVERGLAWIPDCRSPQYVSLSTGLGSSGFSIQTTESKEAKGLVGYVTSINQTATTQDVPKAITTISGAAATVITAVGIKDAISK